MSILGCSKLSGPWNRLFLLSQTRYAVSIILSCFQVTIIIWLTEPMGTFFCGSKAADVLNWAMAIAQHCLLDSLLHSSPLVRIHFQIVQAPLGSVPYTNRWSLENELWKDSVAHLTAVPCLHGARGQGHTSLLQPDEAWPLLVDCVLCCQLSHYCIYTVPERINATIVRGRSWGSTTSLVCSQEYTLELFESLVIVGYSHLHTSASYPDLSSQCTPQTSPILYAVWN